MPSSCGKVWSRCSASSCSVAGAAAAARARGRCRSGRWRRSRPTEIRSSGGEPVVVELVAGVADPLSARPADRRQLVGGERLGHEHVVVHRDDVVPQPLQQRRVRVGAEEHLPAPDPARRRVEPHPVPLVVHPGDRGALVDDDAEPLSDVREAPHEPRRIDDRRRARVVERPEVGRGVDERAGLLRVEQLDLLAEPAGRLGELGEVGQLQGSTATSARRCGGSRSRCRARRRSPRSRRGSPRPGEQGRHLVRPAVQAVREAVGQARGAEPAVAAGRRPRGRRPRRGRRNAPGRPAWRGRRPTGR